MSVAQGNTERKAVLLRPDFSLTARVAAVGAVLSSPHRGAVSHLAQRFRISRQRASVLVRAGRAALEGALAPRPSGRPERVTALEVDNDRVRRAVLSLGVDARASNAQTQICLESILDRHVSTGRISGLLKEGAEKAQEALAALPMPAAPVHAVADELYDHNRPVLILMEDEHLAILGATQDEQADGTTWGVHMLDLLARGLKVDSLITDQGTGMAAGMRDADFVPPKAAGSDVFHVLYRMSPEVRHLAHQARKTEETVQKLLLDLDYLTAPRHGRGRPRKGTTLEAIALAQVKAAHAKDRAEAARYLYAQTREFLAPVDPDGGLIDAPTARMRTAAVVALAQEADLGVLAEILSGTGERLHAFRPALEVRYRDLAVRHSQSLVAFVGWVWTHRRQLHESLPRTQDELRQRWSITAPLTAVAEIWHALRNCHRSSSVLEGLNSQVRGHERAHRGLHTSFLPLLVYRHNVEPFRRGLHRGEAPFVALGILPADPRHWADRLFDPIVVPPEDLGAPIPGRQACAPLPTPATPSIAV